MKKEKYFFVTREINKRGFTVAEIAEKLGVTRNTLNRQINGNPNVNTLKKIADALNCNIVDFFQE